MVSSLSYFNISTVLILWFNRRYWNCLGRLFSCLRKKCWLYSMVMDWISRRIKFNWKLLFKQFKTNYETMGISNHSNAKVEKIFASRNILYTDFHTILIQKSTGRSSIWINCFLLYLYYIYMWSMS